MVDLLIRDLDPAVHEDPERRAQDERVSLQVHVSRVLGEHAVRPAIAQRLRRLDELPRHVDVLAADVLHGARSELP